MSTGIAVLSSQPKVSALELVVHTFFVRRTPTLRMLTGIHAGVHSCDAASPATIVVRRMSASPHFIENAS